MNAPVECRSVLFMPASNARALAKGPSLDCDGIIVDLEDSVAASAKSVARQQGVSALRELDFGYRLRALRINACDTQWHNDDISAAAQCAPDAIVLPKADTPDQIARLSLAMDAFPELANTRIWAMMESPMAVLNAQAIAASAVQYSRLSMLIVGSNDLALTAGMPVDVNGANRVLQVPWLMMFIAAAKAYGLQILDTVYNDFADVEGFTRECEQGIAMGMNGKSLIHPKQVPVANRVFAPSADQVSTASAIVSAFSKPENADKGAIAIDGRMTERLHLGMAEKLLERVERLRNRT